MHDPDDAGSENEPFDPDDVVWVRGVDYVAGRRDATESGGELAEALTMAGFDWAVHLRFMDASTACRSRLGASPELPTLSGT